MKDQFIIRWSDYRRADKGEWLQVTTYDSNSAELMYYYLCLITTISIVQLIVEVDGKEQIVKEK